MEETHTGTEKMDIKRIIFILCALKMRMCMSLYMFSHGFNRTEDSSAQAPAFSLVDMEKKVWGISARRGCDVNVMIPGLPSRILWCLECYPSYPGGGLCFQHLLTLICSGIPFLSKSYSPGRVTFFTADVFVQLASALIEAAILPNTMF